MDDISTKNQKRAIEEKDIGNSAYKKKEFSRALEHYKKAIGLDKTNITFYTNKAAVYFEQGEHEKCRETCLKAIEIGRDHGADYKLVAKAYARIGNSFMREKKFDEARNFFKISLEKNNIAATLEKLEQCDAEIKDVERLAYINPNISKEERGKGNEACRAGKFSVAISHYSEAIKRNPGDAKLYSSRAAVHMKLNDFKSAVDDCTQCIQKDPTYVKGHIMKGAALEALSDYDSAMDLYERAMDLDPNSAEAMKAYYRCLKTDYQDRNNPVEVRKRAMKDPEVQQIISDPATKLILEKMRENPEAVIDFTKLEDSSTAEKLQDLINIGLIDVR